MRWARHAARIEEIGYWWPEGKRPIGRPRHRWVDIFIMDLGDRMGWCGLDRSGSG
jgi:hypothetical protein